MKTIHAIRWALYERFLSAVWLLLGLAIAAGGVWIGAGDVIVSAIYGGSGGSAQSLPLAVGAVLVGLVIWQLGSTIASLKTIAGATATADEEQIDRLQRTLTATIEQRFEQLESESGGGAQSGTVSQQGQPDSFGGGEDEMETGAGHAGRERATYEDTEGTDGDTVGAKPATGTDPNAAFEDD